MLVKAGKWVRRREKRKPHILFISFFFRYHIVKKYFKKELEEEVEVFKGEKKKK
jgi:hypothetical protein